MTSWDTGRIEISPSRAQTSGTGKEWACLMTPLSIRATLCKHGAGLPSRIHGREPRRTPQQKGLDLHRWRRRIWREIRWLARWSWIPISANGVQPSGAQSQQQYEPELPAGLSTDLEQHPDARYQFFDTNSKNNGIGQFAWPRRVTTPNKRNTHRG